MSAPGRAAPVVAPPALGTPRLHLRRTDSTNERARALAAAGAPHGTLVTAGEQTAGRGRQGRSWVAPPGGALLMSLVLREPPRLLPLSAAVAICDVAGARASIKWPNDILLERTDGGRGKVAGILVEGRPQEDWAVLGIGLNVAVSLDQLPRDLRGSAATLGLDPAELDSTLTHALAALERWLAADEQEVLAAWRGLDALDGRTVTWAGGSGRAAGVDGSGRLIVERSGGGRETLAAGEVHLLDD